LVPVERGGGESGVRFQDWSRVENRAEKKPGEAREKLREREIMDTTTLIRVVSGVLVVIILIVLIQRRRTRVK